MQLPQRPVPLPTDEIVVHRRAWRQVSRQRPPLAPRLENVEDRVQHLAKIDLASPALTAPRYIHQRPPAPTPHPSCRSDSEDPSVRSSCGSPPSTSTPPSVRRREQNHKRFQRLKSFSDRLLQRLDNPDKNWKFSIADMKERGYWNEYAEAYEDMIRATAANHAP